MTVRTIRADYDDEEKVFYTFDSDVPGLLADGAMLEELQGKIAQRFTEMLISFSTRKNWLDRMKSGW